MNLKALPVPAPLANPGNQTLQQSHRYHWSRMNPAVRPVPQDRCLPCKQAERELRTLRIAGLQSNPLEECAFSSDPLRNHRRHTGFSADTRTNGGLIIFTARRYVKPLFGESAPKFAPITPCCSELSWEAKHGHIPHLLGVSPNDAPSADSPSTSPAGLSVAPAPWPPGLYPFWESPSRAV